MKMDRMIRSARIITILFSLLLFGSLNAERRSYVVVADIGRLFRSTEKDPERLKRHKEDVKRVMESIKATVQRVNEQVIMPHNALIDAEWANFQAVNAQIAKDNEAIKTHNKSGKTDKKPYKKYLPKPQAQQRKWVKVDPTDLHMTLAYIGFLDDTGPQHREIITFLQQEIRRVIRTWSTNTRCTQLNLRTDRFMWPTLGEEQKIWIGMKVVPATKEVAVSLLALLNGIQDVLQKVQTRCNCFEDKFFRKKVFKKWSNLEEVGLHISFGRLFPPYESFLVQLQDGTFKKIKELTRGDRVAQNTDGSPVLVEDATESRLLMDLNEQERQKTFKLLGIQGSTMLQGLGLQNPRFVLNGCELTGKHTHLDIVKEGVFALRCEPQLTPEAPAGTGPSRAPQQPMPGAPIGAGPSRRPQQPQVSRTSSGSIIIKNLDHPSSIQFSPQSQESLVAKQANGKVVYVYDIHKDPKVKGPEVGQFRIAQSGTPFNVTMDPAGSFIVVLSEGLRNDRGLFAISTDSLKANQPGLRKLMLSPHNSQATALHRMPGRWPAPTFISASVGGDARIWELKNDGNTFSYNLKHEGMNHPRNRINDAISNRDGSRTITVSDDNTAVIWNYVNKKKYTLRHQDPVSKATFSRDGMRVATSSGSRVYIWEVATGKPVVSYDFGSPVQGIRFEGETLFVRLDNAIVAWKNAMKMVSGGAEAFNLVRYDQEGVRATSFAVFNDILIVGTDRGYAQVWSIGQNGQGPKRQLGKFTGPITSITFTRDGKKLAISDDNSIQIFFGS